MAATADRIVLLDGYAQIYRGYYAVRGLTNARGEPTNALFAMARLLLKLDQDLPHGYGALVLDKGRSVKRIALLPAYKATRPPMPDELRAQLPAIRAWTEAAGWPLFEEDGREADDLIGAIVARRDGHETVIVSHDKDLTQLIGDGVTMLQPGGKSGLERMGTEEVLAKFGVPPAAIPDYLALVGDSSDNIPGVPGVGAKTAAALLQRFGSIEAMVAQLDAVEPAGVRTKLRDAAELLRRNRELTTVDCTAPPAWRGLDSLRRQPPAWDVLVQIAKEHNLKSLLPMIERNCQDARNPTLF